MPRGRPKLKDESPAVRNRRTMNTLLRAADAEYNLMKPYDDDTVEFIRTTADSLRKRDVRNPDENPDQLLIPGVPSPAGTDNTPVFNASFPDEEDES